VIWDTPLRGQVIPRAHPVLVVPRQAQGRMTCLPCRHPNRSETAGSSFAKISYRDLASMTCYNLA
jgi:hypothetical protein